MTPIRIIAFGAHPDDCDIRAGGTAALWAEMGHAVKFVSVTNGDAGHHEMEAAALARRRRAESEEAGRRLGIAGYEVLDFHDGQLLPTLEAREEVIRLIREWRADLVLGPRPHDYHADHRYTGVLVQDAAYLVVVPALVRAAPALRKNPVFLYYEDRFQKPSPFRADVRVRIDAVLERKLGALDAHASQFYEWLPWVEGNAAAVPESPAARREWLRRTRLQRHYEAFELCEYGAHVGEADIGRLFPMLEGGKK